MIETSSGPDNLLAKSKLWIIYFQCNLEFNVLFNVEFIMEKVNVFYCNNPLYLVTITILVLRTIDYYYMFDCEYPQIYILATKNL